VLVTARAYVDLKTTND